MSKKIIIFEGLGCSGKSTLIDRVFRELKHDFRIEVLNNLHPIHTSILFSRNRLVAFERGALARVFFRWTRLFLFFDHILKSKSDIFLLDRGLLTSYIYGKIDSIPDIMLLEVIDELLAIIEGFSYRTVLVNCKIEVANERLLHRPNINVEQKLERNFLFQDYLQDISQYPFIHDSLIMETTDDIFKDYSKLMDFILK